MAKTLDPNRAANILDKWINFYGMDDPDAWPPEDYGYVKQACKAMRLAIDILRGGSVVDPKEVKKTVQVLREWPTVHSMDNPNVWDEISFTFVRNALEAVLYAATYLEKKGRGTGIVGWRLQESSHWVTAEHIASDTETAVRD